MVEDDGMIPCSDLFGCVDATVLLQIFQDQGDETHGPDVRSIESGSYNFVRMDTRKITVVHILTAVHTKWVSMIVLLEKLEQINN